MPNVTKALVLGLMLAASSACDDGKATSGNPTRPTDPDTQEPSPNTDTPDAPAEQEFLLTDWVHALVEERTSDGADPDTVDDKKIIDTDDPAAFDTYVTQK